MPYGSSHFYINNHAICTAAFLYVSKAPINLEEESINTITNWFQFDDFGSGPNFNIATISTRLFLDDIVVVSNVSQMAYSRSI